MFTNKRNFVIFSILLVMIMFILMVPLTIAKAASTTVGSETNTFPSFPAIWATIFPLLGVLLILTFFDFIIGVLVAVVSKTFKWEYLIHYVNTDILPILAWLVMEILSFIPSDLLPVGSLPPIIGASLVIFAYGMYTTVVLSILKSLMDSFKQIGILGDGGKIEPPL